jgi:hypothetical protein
MPTYRIFAVGRDQHFLSVSRNRRCVDDNEAVDKPMQLANFRDRLSIAEVVLVTLTERLGINRRHLLHVVTERYQLSSYAMRRHAGLNTD